jgi:hypothetical protein
VEGLLLRFLRLDPINKRFVTFPSFTDWRVFSTSFVPSIDIDHEISNGFALRMTRHSARLSSVRKMLVDQSLKLLLVFISTSYPYKG